MKSLLFFLFLLLSVSRSQADVLPIHGFKTPKGLEVWLVEDKTSPVISLKITFSREKVSSPLSPLSLLLGEAIEDGAGLMTPLELKREANRTPFRGSVSLGISKDTLSLKTTKAGLKSTLSLWSRLIGSPRFQSEGIDRSKAQALSNIAAVQENLSIIAFFGLLKAIFHEPALQLSFETAAPTLQALQSSDLTKAMAHHFLQKKPLIVVVGNTTQKDLAPLLDATFGSFLLHSESVPSPLRPHWDRGRVSVERDLSQAVVALGHPGVDPQSKNYPQFKLLQSILSHRFFEEIREKRGLIYGIQFFDPHYNGTSLLVGDFSCACTNANKVIRFVRSEWQRLKDFGVTEQELTQAKLSFKQQHILSLTSTDAVASVCADFQNANLGPRAATTLLEKTEKVTLEEINGFLEKFFEPSKLVFSIVGPDSILKEKK